MNEGLFYLGIHDKVEIPLPVPVLRVSKGVVSLTIFLLDNRKRPDRFAQNSKLFCKYAKLTNLCHKSISLNPYYITDIQVPFKNNIIKGLVFPRAQFIPVEVHLDLTFRILYFGK